MDLRHYHPYQRRVFWTVFLLSIGLITILSGTLYYYVSRELFTQTQQDLRSIAEKTVALIPVEVHEKLQAPEDQYTDGYKQIEAILKSVMAGNPKIDDIYTLRPTNNANTMTFVVSGKDTVDANHDGVIEENEIKAALGATYDVSTEPFLVKGLTGPSYDSAITYDKWGAWLSGYAPLKNAEGASVAVLGVDYSAAAVSADSWKFFIIILRVDVVMLPFGFFCAWFLSRRIQRPLQVVAKAMDTIVHGDPGYRIPATGNRDEKVIANFFNTTKDVLWEEARREAKKEPKK